MPLVNIDLLAGRTDQDLRLIGDAVHEAMVEQLDVPQRDRFQVVTQHSAATLQFDRHYLDIERSDQFVMVKVTLSAGRTDEAKSGFYRRLGELLAERIELRPEWDAIVAKVLKDATLETPKPRRATVGGRKGHHSEHLGHLLTEMQFLQRAYPDAKW